MRFRQIFSLGLSGIILLLSVSSSASVVIALDKADLARDADAIIWGKVIQSESFWDESGKGILTKIDITVDRVLKGGINVKILTIVQRGGTIDGYRQIVFGQAQFFIGEEVIVFLEQKENEYVVKGMAQGKFSIQKDPITGKRLAVRELDGLGFASKDKSDAVLLDKPLYVKPQFTLDDLLTEIERWTKP
jgi:hypothetical protein